MNKCTVYAWTYIISLVLLAMCAFDWATPLEFGGMSYGCGEELPVFTVNDCIKTIIGAVAILTWGIVGLNLVIQTCAQCPNQPFTGED